MTVLAGLLEGGAVLPSASSAALGPAVESGQGIFGAMLSGAATVEEGLCLLRFDVDSDSPDAIELNQDEAPEAVLATLTVPDTGPTARLAVLAAWHRMVPLTAENDAARETDEASIASFDPVATEMRPAELWPEVRSQDVFVPVVPMLKQASMPTVLADSPLPVVSSGPGVEPALPQVRILGPEQAFGTDVRTAPVAVAAADRKPGIVGLAPTLAPTLAPMVAPMVAMLGSQALPLTADDVGSGVLAPVLVTVDGDLPSVSEGQRMVAQQPVLPAILQGSGIAGAEKRGEFERSFAVLGQKSDVADTVSEPVAVGVPSGLTGPASGFGVNFGGLGGRVGVVSPQHSAGLAATVAPVRIAVDGPGEALRVSLAAPEAAVAALEGGRGELAAALRAQGMRLESLAVRPAGDDGGAVSGVASVASVGVSLGADLSRDVGREAGDADPRRGDGQQSGARDDGRASRQGSFMGGNAAARSAAVVDEGERVVFERAVVDRFA